MVGRAWCVMRGASSKVCEDEMHIMECPCYGDVRERCSQVFTGSDNSNITDHEMWNMGNGDCNNSFWERVPNFILKGRERRAVSIA
jgi:hypothetical protein